MWQKIILTIGHCDAKEWLDLASSDGDGGCRGEPGYHRQRDEVDEKACNQQRHLASVLWVNEEVWNQQKHLVLMVNRWKPAAAMTSKWVLEVLEARKIYCSVTECSLSLKVAYVEIERSREE